ncbi:MAG: dihydropteroate synthase [Nitrospirae bacterium]|jgi:5-methyltetrahydrofolate corrinoid/iron sulfur protein methyltransferase|nr:dihydropteroate synthase [Nitrospirota bacterium]
MIAVADNLNTRNKAYMEALKNRDVKALAELVKHLREAGADMINVQCSLDGSGDDMSLPWVTGIVSEISDSICLDSRNTLALENALPLCKKPPLINFISETEPEDQETLLSIVSNSGASLVIRASKGTIPTSIEAKLQIIERLIEMANEADIPNERLFADPSVVHVSSGMGQKHILNSYECIRVLKDLVEPPIKTIAWISNVSSGLPRVIRKPLEATFLAYLAGAGLDAALVDIHDGNIRKAIYLIKSFKDEIVFSQADIT